MARKAEYVRGKWRYVDELGFPEWAQEFVPVQDRTSHDRG